MPSAALLQAPKIKRIPISGVASVKTSGVLVTVIFFFLAASVSILPKPSAKLERIFTLFGNFSIVSASSLSVNADNSVTFYSPIINVNAPSSSNAVLNIKATNTSAG